MGRLLLLSREAYRVLSAVLFGPSRDEEMLRLSSFRLMKMLRAVMTRALSLRACVSVPSSLILRIGRQECRSRNVRPARNSPGGSYRPSSSFH